MMTAAELRFERLAIDDVDFEALDQYEDRVFSQRRNWLDFLTRFVPGEVVIAAIMRGHEQVGFFTGILFRRSGVKILASPFRGWTTPYMGFNLNPDMPRGEALVALERFAFRELGCLHVEVADRYISLEDGLENGYSHRIMHGYLSDLTKSETALWEGMTSSCRRAIRKSEKSGVTIIAGEPDGFAGQYYEHLCHVFAKQGLKPTYGADRVQHLIDHCYPSGDLLLLRAFEPGGQCIATGIYPGFRHYSFFWGNGSHPDHLRLRPNEALHWYALRYWRDRGVHFHDWAGPDSYKAKYGGAPFTAHAFAKSSHRLIGIARDTAEWCYYFPRKFLRRRYDAQVAARRSHLD